jgi:hypothetical protein
MQRVEVGHPVKGEHHGLAIDHKSLGAVLDGCLDDPRVALAPVIAAASDQPHALAIPLDAQAIAVVLDLVKPL